MFEKLDLEATGIPGEEINKTRITELSFIAVKRQHLRDCRPGDKPRVQQKITLCLNPLRLIQPGATEVSGLCNDLLEYEPRFNSSVCSILQSFINVLTKPVCLIAHNGFKFDYPLLQNHLHALGITFDEDLLCADSLQAFHSILENNYVDTQPLPEYVQNAFNQEAIISCDDQDPMVLSKPVSIQSVNEMTPKKQVSRGVNLRNHKHLVKHSRPETKARKQLFYNNGPKPKTSYKLCNIYERLLKTPAIDCHRAESDCIMLLKCAVAVSESFVMWVDANHGLFNKVNPMRIGVRIGE